jgi:iron only hydrogenase large subunit-like protein
VLPGRGNDYEDSKALIELYWDKIRYPNNENVHIQLNGNSSKKAYLRYQGTSSKDYYRWNWRTNFTKDSTITYLDKVDESGKNIQDTNSKLTWYTLDGTEFKCSYIAAKKNTASSMQSHKIGFTSSYQDLYDKLADKGSYPDLKSELLYDDG